MRLLPLTRRWITDAIASVPGAPTVRPDHFMEDTRAWLAQDALLGRDHEGGDRLTASLSLSLPTPDNGVALLHLARAIELGEKQWRRAQKLPETALTNFQIHADATAGRRRWATAGSLALFLAPPHH